MVSLNLVMVFGLLILIGARGLGHFWPAEVSTFELRSGDGSERRTLLGTVVDEEQVTAQRVRDTGAHVPDDVTLVMRYLIKVGNRDLTGADFVWINETDIVETGLPEHAVVIEREEWGNFYGFLADVRSDEPAINNAEPWPALEAALDEKLRLDAEIEQIEKHDIGAINYAMERIRLRERGLELDGISERKRFEALDRDPRRTANRLRGA